jgi:hypothetical protein
VRVVGVLVGHFLDASIYIALIFFVFQKIFQTTTNTISWIEFRNQLGSIVEIAVTKVVVQLTIRRRNFLNF